MAEARTDRLRADGGAVIGVAGTASLLTGRTGSKVGQEGRRASTARPSVCALVAVEVVNERRREARRGGGRSGVCMEAIMAELAELV